MKNGVGIGAGESSFQCVWIENSDKTETEAQLQHVLRAWTRARPDTCLLSSDGQRVFTHRALFGLHSRMLRASLASLETTELAIISAPSSAKSLRNLSRLLLNGVVVSSSREDLKETEEAAACLGNLFPGRNQRALFPFFFRFFSGSSHCFSCPLSRLFVIALPHLFPSFAPHFQDFVGIRDESAGVLVPVYCSSSCRTLYRSTVLYSWETNLLNSALPWRLCAVKSL